MKMKMKLAILLGLGLVASMAQAQLVFVQTNVQRAESLDWTFGFDATGTQTNSSDMYIQSGALTAGSANDSVSITVIGASNWVTSAAQTAIAGGTFSNYVAGLGTPADLTAIQSSKLAVDGAGGDFRSMDYAGEAIIMTFSGISLAETSLFSFESIGWQQGGSSELADVFFYDSSENSVSNILSQSTGSAVTGIDDYFSGGIAEGDQIIVAYNSGNWKVGSFTVDVFPAPTTGVVPPINLTATPSNSLIVLNWLPDTSGQLNYFEVYRSTDGTNYTFIDTTAINSYNDFSLVNGSTYYYKAKAVDNSSFVTDFSEPAFATPFIPVPTGLEAEEGNGEVVLDWDDSIDYLFDSFNVWRSETQGTNYAVIATDVPSSTYTDTDVVNETTYYYVVSQVDVNGGESAVSLEEAEATPTTALVVLNPNNSDMGLIRVPTNGATYATNSVDAGVQTTTMRVGQYSTSIPTLARCIIQFDLTQQDIIDAGKTTNDIARVLLRVNAYNNNLLSPEDASGDGSAVEVYASQTKGIDNIVPADFDNPSFDNFIGTIPGLTNNNGLANYTWFEIDVTDAVMADLANDTNSFGSAFRLQLNNDVLLTNANYAAANNLTNRSYVSYVQFRDNGDADDWPELRIEFTSGTAYTQWAQQWAPADVSVQTADNDNDGLSNLYEYGVNGNPTNSLDQGTLPTFTKVGDVFSYVHPQRSDDDALVYTVQTKTNLLSGSWTDFGYVVNGTNLTGGTLNFVTNTVDTIEDQRFIRLQVEYSE